MWGRATPWRRALLAASSGCRNATTPGLALATLWRSDGSATSSKRHGLRREAGGEEGVRTCAHTRDEALVLVPAPPRACNSFCVWQLTESGNAAARDLARAPGGARFSSSRGSARPLLTCPGRGHRASSGRPHGVKSARRSSEDQGAAFVSVSSCWRDGPRRIADGAARPLDAVQQRVRAPRLPPQKLDC